MPVETREIRSAIGAHLEVRAVGDAPGSPVIAGYAALWDTPSSPIMGEEEEGPAFTEIVRRGAFSRSIASGSDVRALWNHETEWILGRVSNGTLKIREDDRGLAFEVVPPDTSWSADLLTLIRRGDVSQCSFAFSVVRDAWSTNNGQYIRELLEVNLIEVSPVTFPAYSQTTVGVRTVRVPDHLTRSTMLDLGHTKAKARLRLAQIKERAHA